MNKAQISKVGMKMGAKIGIKVGALLVLWLAAVGTWAEGEADKAAPAAGETPHQVVERVTTELMAVVQDGETALKENPEKYFQDVRKIMESSVDFGYIAQNVMGKKYWLSASEEQRAKFTEVFTSGLAETYAKGMANFADFEISVEPPAEPVGKRRKVEVIQKFKGPEGINRVSYSMGKHPKFGWKLLNVVLDGVNLGKTLRAQFARSVEDANGDLDAAIEGWTWDSEPPSK